MVSPYKSFHWIQKCQVWLKIVNDDMVPCIIVRSTNQFCPML